MFSYCNNHSRKPERAQRHDNSITHHKHAGKPPRRPMFEYKRPFSRRVIVLGPERFWCMERGPHIAKKHNSEVRTPDQPAAGKDNGEKDAVDDLEGRARFARFVEEPVDVGERGGKLHQRVLDAVIQAKRVLTNPKDIPVSKMPELHGNRDQQRKKKECCGGRQEEVA